METKPDIQTSRGLTLRASLKRHTAARVMLDRVGSALATHDQLAFQLDHALARDAVHASLDLVSVMARISALGLRPIELASAVQDASPASSRATYLRRPDLGRRLAAASLEHLTRDVITAPTDLDVAFIVADGLSALAVDRHATSLIAALLVRLGAGRWRIGPVPVVLQARVAIGDQIGAVLGARMTVLLIGERPGLSAPDSLGAYLTWNPRPGRTDAERNCISNIHGGGLTYEEAAERITAYMNQARALGYTGVHLKESTMPALPRVAGPETA